VRGEAMAMGGVYWCPQGVAPSGVVPLGVAPSGGTPGGVMTPGGVVPSGVMPGGVTTSGVLAPTGVVPSCFLVPMVRPSQAGAALPRAPADLVASVAAPVSSLAPSAAPPAFPPPAPEPHSLRLSPVELLRQKAEAAGEPEDVVMAMHALEFSHDRQGCLWVQQALDRATDDGTRLAIMGALRGHVWDVIRCPHANHVLQRFIITVRPCECQFVIDEILRRGPGVPGRLARHKYSYRVLQRMLEHLQQWQMAPIVHRLVADGLALSMHRFGTFVMQHILRYGSEMQQRRTIGVLVSNAPDMALNNDACMVLDAALVDGDERSRERLAQAVLAKEGAIADMSHTRRGHVAVLSLLQVLGAQLLGEAIRQLSAQEVSLKSSRFGRIVVKAFHKRAGGEFSAALAGA